MRRFSRRERNFMLDKESSLPEDWFKKGEDDKQAVGILIEHGGKSSVAAFLIQQMLEKYMKGFLLSKGWKLKRTHDLEELLDEMVEFDKSFEKFREIAQKATAFYFLERYPFFSEELNREEVKNTFLESLKLIKKIEKSFETG